MIPHARCRTTARFALFLCLALLTPAGLTAQDFVFRQIAATEGPADSLLIFPALNKTGTVAYVYSPEFGHVQVLATKANQTTTIADLTGPAFSISTVGAVSINRHGTVAFSAVLDDGQTGVIYSGDGGPLTTIAEATANLQTFFGIPSINFWGTVAFGAYLRDAHEALFTGNGGVLTTVAVTGDQFSSFHSNGGPSLNNHGTVAFTVDRGRGLGLGVYTIQDGVLTTIAEGSDTFIVVEGRPAINNAGLVAFLAFFSDNGQWSEGVFVGSGGSPPVLVASGSISGTPAINDAGAVAYLLIGSDGQEYLNIKATPDADAITVIQTGAELSGSTIRVLGLSTYGFQTRNRVAFGAQLDDGRSVIVLAHPPRRAQ